MNIEEWLYRLSFTRDGARYVVISYRLREDVVKCYRCQRWDAFDWWRRYNMHWAITRRAPIP